MNSLSKQVSKLSQELHEMTCLLKPLLQTASPPLLMTIMPNLTPPPSSASQLSTSTCLVLPPPVTSCSYQRPDTHSLLDSGDTEGVDLPGCLLPTPHSPKRPNLSSSASIQTPPKPSGGSMKGHPHSNLPSPEEGLPEGSPVLQSLFSSSSNGIFLPSPQDQPPLASHSPSPSLSFSMSLSSSPSLSPCQGPHLSRPGSCASRGLLPPPPSQDTPPPLSSHCSAPPSLTSSPGDLRLRPSPSVPLVSPTVTLHPSTHSLPLSLDFVRETQTPLQCKSQLRHREARPVTHPQELEMQEWGRQAKEGKTSTEDISFIDEEEPTLWAGSVWTKVGGDSRLAENEGDGKMDTMRSDQGAWRPDDGIKTNGKQITQEVICHAGNAKRTDTQTETHLGGRAATPAVSKTVWRSTFLHWSTTELQQHKLSYSINTSVASVDPCSDWDTLNQSTSF